MSSATVRHNRRLFIERQRRDSCAAHQFLRSPDLADRSAIARDLSDRDIASHFWFR